MGIFYIIPILFAFTKAKRKGLHMMQNYESYICFSTKPRKFMDQNGTRWIDKGTHEVSGHPYWVFKKTRKFKDLLDRYDREK